jgi:hypothetical protein
MSQRSMSLVDILTPPRNNWLRQLARRKSDLPAGVRVVRFSDYDDDTEVVEAIAPAPARQDQMTGQAAVGTRSSATASAKRMPSTAAESIPPA